MNSYLALQHTYHGIELALVVDKKVLEILKEDKKLASKNFILLVDDLLKRHHMCLQQLSFIVVNQGPGPFTTLRVVIATANGLSFATGIPLVGVDGLHALLNQDHHNKDMVRVALLNAFSSDVYYAVSYPDQSIIDSGYRNIDVLLDELKTIFGNQPIRFIGNGVQLYRQQVELIFGPQALMEYPMIEHCSIAQIAKMGLDYFNRQENISHQLMPLYLKSQFIQPLSSPSNF